MNVIIYPCWDMSITIKLGHKNKNLDDIAWSPTSLAVSFCDNRQQGFNMTLFNIGVVSSVKGAQWAGWDVIVWQGLPVLNPRRMQNFWVNSLFPNGQSQKHNFETHSYQFCQEHLPENAVECIPQDFADSMPTMAMTWCHQATRHYLNPS